MDLTPTELHYFKRELIRLELLRELDQLRRNPEITTLLARNVDPAKDTYPFLRYIAQEFVIEFPLLKRGDKPEFWEKCQLFLDEFSKVKLDTYSPRRTGASQRRVLMYKAEKLLTVAMCATVKTNQGQDQPLDVRDKEQSKKQNKDEEENLAESLDKNMTLLENEDHYLEWMGFNGLQIDVVTVREVSEKRTLREKLHAEFVLSTTIAGEGDKQYFVTRRHGDFRQLQQDLKSEFPLESVPNVPKKASDPSYERAGTGEDGEDDGQEDKSSSASGSSGNKKKAEKTGSSSSLLGSSLSSHFHRRRSHSNAGSDKDNNNGQLYREKDRLLLRSFLHRVATDSELAKSETFRKFLTRDPITLTPEQMADAERRHQVDLARAAEEARFKEEVDRKMSELNDLLDMLKKQIMQPGGLKEVFQIIKTTARIEDLPEPMRKAFEWGRINFAFVLHTQFVSSDRAAENIANLKRTHMLMPYRAVAQILKLSNPFTMVKGVLDLFLAQPLGRRSLLQRIIVSTMQDGDKEAQQDISDLEAAINDPILIGKVKNAVATSMPEEEQTQRVYNRRADPTEETLAMLRNPDIEPSLTPKQILNLQSSSELVNQVHRLWTLYARQREHKLLGDLMFQGTTGELLREIFAMFYTPLAQVYRSANIGDSLQHLSAFIDDLVGVINSVNVLDARNTAQPFVQLVQRHEQQFYTFVHNVHANDTSHLFDELLSYVDNMFSLIANGLPNRIDLDKAAAEAQADTQLLRKDADALCEYHWKRKEQHMKRTRQKLMMEQDDFDSSDEAKALDFLPNSAEMLRIIDDLAEFDPEEHDAEDSDEALEHEMLIAPPELQALPKVVPVFVRHVAQVMPSKNA
ncbi:hypothetical protein BDB00DRAFT_811506 [Zychaea mexicana]|uniref:uncharacterized protein n=1 Tax=Zychaea mexicana TaxID=64656 RepID=UPI0022FEE178|nr:uncharacterized protein BDB00DRAFT_811506 [Zychaea mexicana]KAI9496047.1 hypothetical protein BDB00DRAFT_811506 [Zychaea mexicana]